MNPIDELRREWTHGWHVDLEYTLPRLVFSKNTGSGTSVCYIYEYADIEGHLKTKCLTNLEYLEAKSFYREMSIQLLKKRIEDRVQFVNSVVTPIFSQQITDRGSINTYKSTQGDKYNA